MIANSCVGFEYMPIEWKNVIGFTIHLVPGCDLRKLSKDLFFHCESFLEKHGCEKRPYARTGVVSFLDYDGTKHSGANLDKNKPHLHGAIILPDNVHHSLVQKLIRSLDQLKENHKARIRSGFEVFMLDGSQLKVASKRRKAGDQLRKPFHTDNLNHLAGWLIYAFKYARKTGSTPPIYFFPYDLKASGKIDPKYQALSDRHDQGLDKEWAHDPREEAEEIRKRSQARRRTGGKMYLCKRNRDFLC